MALLPVLVLDGVTIQMPMSHGWVSPSGLGVGGAGNVVIPGIWSYRLSWSFLDPEKYKEVWDIWNDNQGQDITVQLPEIGADPYALTSFTCRINPITNNGFFEGFYQQVTTSLVGIDITA